MGKNPIFKCIIISIFAILMLTACNSEKSSKGKDVKAEEKDTADMNIKKEDNEKPEESGDTDKDASTDNTTGAVKPKSASETVSFTQVNWFFGSPKRELTPGVWYYTAADHPEKFDTTFDWETEDVLLWQIGDEKYRGFGGETKQLQILGNDVIKIIVKLEKEEEEEGMEMPRRFLTVAKGALEGKSFIVETVDGERLSLE